MMGSGGGSPKNLQLSKIENTLLDFLTPDATGLSNIAEGGFENFSPVHKEKMTERRSKGNNYSYALSSIKDVNNIDKISLSDSSEGLSHNMSQAKKRLFSVKDRKPIKKRNETLVSPFNIYRDKENIQDEYNEINTSPLHTKYGHENAIYNKYSPDKVSLSDSSEDLMSHNLSQTKRMLSPIMDKKQTKKISETSVSLLDNDIYTNKENMQDKDKMTPLNTKYENIKEKYSQDIKKPKLMTAAIDLLEKKTVTSENIKLQILDIKKEKMKLKKEELDVHQNVTSITRYEYNLINLAKRNCWAIFRQLIKMCC